MGKKTKSNRDEKRGEKTEKKQRGESFICSEKGEKNRESNKEEKRGKKVEKK